MKLFSLLLLTAAAFAQPATTQVQDTLYDQTGALYHGPLTITLSAQSGASGGYSVLSTVKTLNIPSSGALNVTLIPNASIAPANTAYVFAFGNGAQKTCVIPASDTPVTLAANCTDAPPIPPTYLLAAWQIDTTGLTRGAYYCLYVGMDGTPSWATCSGGGGTSGGLAWSTLSGTAWLSMTSDQWLNLTN